MSPKNKTYGTDKQVISMRQFRTDIPFVNIGGKIYLQVVGIPIDPSRLFTFLKLVEVPSDTFNKTKIDYLISNSSILMCFP